MNRRDFLKLTSAAGLCLGGSALLGRAWADGEVDPGNPVTYAGPLFVMVQATGGWDPTLLCDPKPSLNNTYNSPMMAGSIPYAPIGVDADAFFNDHHDKMTVINGVDTATNNHEAGRRHLASGRLGSGYPNLAALVAGVKSPESPMAFLTFGGYERTQGVVAPVRDGNGSRLAELAYPDRINPTDEASATYHSAAAQEIIKAAREERAGALLGNQELPRYQHSLDTLMTARAGAGELKLLQEVLPEPDANADFRKCQLIVAAYKAGIGVSANLAMGGFDTHSSHDADHIPRMRTLLRMVSFLWAEAARQGVEDKLVVLMSSDFGRSPGYNGNGGKDHWSVSSMIAMGNGIPGDRVVGRTTDAHSLMDLDPTTLAEPAADGTDGARIGPMHVHRALRKILDVEGSDLDSAFPLGTDEDDLPIFG
ncbi:DUF1501 domain-containing protein [Paraliomyxa miuraensis]|uniref:DUF1501 domain-containing protein n=1 Tax=Paraliomyxa miuraensis TaxID=376150 RepID=UPI00224FC5FE|nr:DUF1501 domain-containing protein [Paraliomyxa miuraensis]MCX4245122.1 DUF1501 domain-containing protein [Paraliomyxa miuraensis]